MQTRVYDRAGRLSSITNKQNGAANAASKFIYTRDPNGNVQRIRTTRGGKVTNEAFTYSLKNWLTNYCPGVTSCTGATNKISYTYSGTGNRLTEQRLGNVPNPGTTTHTYDAADQLIRTVETTTGGSTTTDHTYTADGQLTDDGRSWNVLGQTVATDLHGTTSFTYDPLGNRRTVTTGAGTTTMSWDNNNQMPMLAVVTDPTGATRAHRYTPTDDVLATEHPTSAYPRSFYGHDAMGSVTDVLTGDGTPAWTYAYEPFGATTTADPLVTGAIDTGFGYTSGYHEPTLDAYALRARDYDTSLGRFLAPDPLAPDLDAAYPSTYLYANNQPTVYTDPTGERVKQDQGGGPCTTEGARTDPRCQDFLRYGDYDFWDDHQPEDVMATLWTATKAGFRAATSDTAVEIYSYGPGVGTGIESARALSALCRGDFGAVAMHATMAVPVAKYGKLGYRAANGGAASVRLGQAGETAVRSAYDIGPKASADIAGRTRIFDGLTDTTVSEVKNVARQSFTLQLRDSLSYAQSTGRTFDLYVRPDTYLTGPLRDAIARGDIGLRFIP